MSTDDKVSKQLQEPVFLDQFGSNFFLGNRASPMDCKEEQAVLKKELRAEPRGEAKAGNAQRLKEISLWALATPAGRLLFGRPAGRLLFGKACRPCAGQTWRLCKDSPFQFEGETIAAGPAAALKKQPFAVMTRALQSFLWPWNFSPIFSGNIHALV